MTVEQLAGIAAIITAFFSGLAIVLRLTLLLAKQVAANTKHIEVTAKVLNGSTKVLDEHTPSE